MNILHLAFQIGLSKRLPRTGWVKRKVIKPESVADHCFRVVVLCMALGSILEVNEEKLLKMGVIHDLGETATGDLVVESWKKIDIKARKKKEEIESKAIKDILWKYGEEYPRLFREMIQRKTREAKVFWQIDVLERTIQAFEYEKEQGIDMTEFFVNADMQIKEPILKKAFEDLKRMRVK